MNRLIIIGLVGLASVARAGETLQRHRYKPGERLEYFFEDTETQYRAEPQDGVLQPKALEKVQEFQLDYVITVSSSGRRLQFRSAVYRGAEPPAFSTAPLRDIASLVPGFPKDFSYAYKSDGQAVLEATPKAYAPFMNDEVGAFVYFKALDVHTIQSMIDSLPAGMKPGQLIQTKGKDIPLPMGSFYNASSPILYQRVVPCGKVRCAFFKAVTMGNSFTQPPAPKLYTNYQYTFLVPLSGPAAGLVWHGDLQETVSEPPGTVVQRQLSIELKP